MLHSMIREETLPPNIYVDDIRLLADAEPALGLIRYLTKLSSRLVKTGPLRAKATTTGCSCQRWRHGMGHKE